MRKALTLTTVSRHSRRIGIVRHGSQMLTVWNCNSVVYVRVTASSELDMTGPSLRAKKSVDHDDERTRPDRRVAVYCILSFQLSTITAASVSRSVCGGCDGQVRA